MATVNLLLLSQYQNHSNTVLDRSIVSINLAINETSQQNSWTHSLSVCIHIYITYMDAWHPFQRAFAVWPTTTVLVSSSST